MLKNISYSVAIRTLGTSGEKYTKLMQSIAKQKIQAKQIIVILPHGYKAPEKILGTEEFYFCKKSMVMQRLEALKYVNTDYILFCDDDIEFDENFTEKLLQPIAEGKADCTAGPLLDFFPPDNIKYKLASVLGGACVMIKGRRNTYTRILKTGGWSYNHDINTNENILYDAESLAWTCFMISKKVMMGIEFEKELWTEKFGYSAFEDRVMFYKLLHRGYKTKVVSNALYIHNDGKSSTSQLKLEPYYAGAFNHYVFWHRYIYSLSNSFAEKLWSRICIEYYLLMSKIYHKTLYLLKKENKEIYKCICKAQKEAKDFVKSEEYMNLPKVIKK